VASKSTIEFKVPFIIISISEFAQNDVDAPLISIEFTTGKDLTDSTIF
jgi:hypothetical protein